VTRVEEVFRALGAEPTSARSAPAAALASEHDEVAGKIAEPRLADLFHAGAAITTEHYEIASYDVLLELARALGRDDLEEPLEQNRREEAEALDRLLKLAEELRGQLPS
jgi:ferritin-like metal-binding protein YciE